MSRFLLALTYTPHLEKIFSPQVYKLKHACTPDDITLPLNTIYFAFFQSKFDSAEALYNEICLRNSSNAAMVLADLQLPEAVNPVEHYFVGKEKTLNGKKGIYNVENDIFVPVDFLSFNDYKTIEL